MLTPITEMVWESDASAAVLRVGACKASLANPIYFARTADLIEDMRDPETNKPLTKSALEAWVERCRSAPEDYDHASTPRRLQPAHRAIPDAAP